MNNMYIDCQMGVAGDMLTASLFELLPDKDGFLKKLNSCGIPGVTFEAEKSVKCGIVGTHMRVIVDGVEEDEHMHEHHHENHHEHEDHHHDEHEHHHDYVNDDQDNHEHAHTHSHNSLHGIEHIVKDHINVSDKVKEDVIAVYNIIAQAESKVHGTTIDNIHFHEVGTMDAIADITAVCMLMEELAPDRVVVSPVHVGSGQVRCAHGILPVPAPATAHILEGIPMYSKDIVGELCTPTGAALIKHFADEYGKMPPMSVKGIGYGMGKKDFPAANCVRVLYGEQINVSEEMCDKPSSDEMLVDIIQDNVVELSCNIDDMTGEEIGASMDVLLANGALDVYTQSIGMKKSRPGVKLSVICKVADKVKLARLMLKHTTTIGVRENAFNRYTLKRETISVNTSYGSVRKKISTCEGIQKEKYEYDDIKKIMDQTDISYREVVEAVRKELKEVFN